MPAFTATATGKIILFGEHAVVYGQPAIAVPVTQVHVRVIVSPDFQGKSGDGHISAPLVDLDASLSELPPEQPLVLILNQLFEILGVKHIPPFKMKISGDIPVAAGMGSGAAVSAAVIRAMSAFLGKPLPDEKVNELVFEAEKIHHGTPSGIDNTVITFVRPVYFIKGKPPEPFRVPVPFTIVIGDTGIASPTALTVGDVRQAWSEDPHRYEQFFSEIGEITRQARQAIEAGTPGALGPLMDANHQKLCGIGVSSPELDSLVAAAKSAGALGSKLSGGGRGGNMIALVQPDQAESVALALENAGAVNTIVTRVAEIPPRN